MTIGRGGTFTVALTIVTVALLVETLQLAPASRLAPLWVIVPTLALLALELTGLAGGAVASPASNHVTGGGGRVSPEEGAGNGSSPVPPGRAFRLVLWGGVLLTLVWTLGFLAAVPLYLAPYLRSEAGLSWRRSLGLTALTAALFWAVFGVLMRAPFPRGVLFG